LLHVAPIWGHRRGRHGTRAKKRASSLQFFFAAPFAGLGWFLGHVSRSGVLCDDVRPVPESSDPLTDKTRTGQGRNCRTKPFGPRRSWRSASSRKSWGLLILTFSFLLACGVCENTKKPPSKTTDIDRPRLDSRESNTSPRKYPVSAQQSDLVAISMQLNPTGIRELDLRGKNNIIHPNPRCHAPSRRCCALGKIHGAAVRTSFRAGQMAHLHRNPSLQGRFWHAWRQLASVNLECNLTNSDDRRCPQAKEE
jgi:hypothetical protein